MREPLTDTGEDGICPPISTLSRKLVPPPLAPRLLPRARLIERLAECTRYRLTVIAACAGSGKTTLLSQFGASLTAEHHAVAWLSLDGGDDDPRRFFGQLVAAAAEAVPGAGSRSLALLRAPHASPEGALAALLEDLGEAKREVVLVLDDYHLIRSWPIHEAMGLALCRLPARVHVLLAARSTPPLPLSRLRARNELLELGAADLRFTVEEATAFLEGAAGLGLAPGIAEALAARAEGWVAGLRLAAHSVQARANGESLLASFSGAQRLLADYLADEVLHREPPEMQAFLLRTSILERLSGPLCDAVTAAATRRGRSSSRGGPSQRILERLERDNLFLVPLDEERRWWRYHRLFGEFLRRRLEEERPEEIGGLRRRAARWLEEHGFSGAAAAHAIEIGEFQRVARLLEQPWKRVGWFKRENSCLLTTAPSTLLRWLGALPEAVLEHGSWLRLMEAFALFEIGQVQAAEARFQDLARDATGDRLLEGRTKAFWAYTAVLRGGGRDAIRLAGRALRLLPRVETGPRVMAHVSIGMAHLSFGRFDSARSDFRQAHAMARPGDGIPWLFSNSMLGGMELMRGRLREAAHFYEEALRLAPWGSEWVPAPAAMPHAWLGYVSYQWNDLSSAARHLDAAIEVGSRTEAADWVVIGCMLLAHVHQSRGEPQAARRIAERAGQLLGSGAVVTPWSANHAQALRVRLWLRQDDLASAARWAESFGEIATIFEDDRDAVNMAWARVMLGLGRPDEVIAPLQRGVSAARSSGRAFAALEYEILRALALAAQGETAGALAALSSALAQARPEGLVRLFLDEGEPMSHLLERAARGRSETSAYARGLLAALQGTEQRRATPGPIPAQRGQPPVEPLSKRELQTLSLIADGLTNPEIAGRLTLTVATVKTHVNNLYAKLGARSRVDAIARARRLGLVRE